MQLVKVISTAILTLSISTAAIASDSLQRQLDAQQRTMLSMQNRMAEMEREIKQLKGSIDELSYRLNSAPAASANTSAPSNTAVSQPKVEQTQTTAQAPVQTADKGSADTQKDSVAGVDDKAQALYDKAYALVLDNKLKEAEQAFGNYIDTYKNNKLTPNAWYWKGQVQYKLQDYDSARVSFLNVVRFEDSLKRPDALYKLGMITKFKGDKEKAQKYFELVIKSYPGDTAATLSQRELGR